MSNDGYADDRFGMARMDEAFRNQRRMLEEVAAGYMAESRIAFQSEQARWRQELYTEEQRMAIYGREEAITERRLVGHQMSDAFRLQVV